MANIKRVSHRIQYEVERLDGGLNTSDAPSRIGDTESPSCKNVVFDDRGAVETRQGTSYLNTGTVGTNTCDGLTVYDDKLVGWFGGDMYYVSGTTLVTVPSAQSQFASGVKVAYKQYQDILFCSDGTNGPWRYEGPTSFFKMGIDKPSACVGASDTSGGGVVAADTYYYAVSFVNTHVIEGEVGSASAGVTLAASASVDVSGIPLGASIQGVARREIYRATSTTGPWLFVKELSDNTTTSFSDNVAVGAEGGESVDDATSPTPFTTIEVHRERLWFDDSSNRTLVRYTEFGNPFVSKALNFTPLNKGDGSNITAIGVQNSLVTVFKTDSIWLVDMTDPADDTTFIYQRSASKGGITGPRALANWNNGIVYAALINGRPVGFQYLSGVDVEETITNLLRTESISERIEDELLAWPSSLWDDIALGEFDNRIYAAVPLTSLSTKNDGIFWFDLTRIGGDGQPGSWAPWDGDVGVNDFAIKDGVLYGGMSDSVGQLISFNNGTYTDASGAAIDSYWWSKQIGGEPSLESWIKDFRFIHPWYALLGSYNMNMRIRLDGDAGDGTAYAVDLTPGGALWGLGAWDEDLWGPDQEELETQESLGSGKLGRRIQVGFDNQAIAGQGFKVFRFRLLMNPRRLRG